MDHLKWKIVTVMTNNWVGNLWKLLTLLPTQLKLSHMEFSAFIYIYIYYEDNALFEILIYIYIYLAIDIISDIVLLCFDV